MEKLRLTPNKNIGKLITFCGLDGCGKTTQIKLLIEYLESLEADVFLTKQPTSFVRQSDIFRTFMDTPFHDSFDYRSLSLLAASDRVQHSNRIILPALQEGRMVISDRYFYSCLSNLRARGYVNDKWIYEISEFIPNPDIAFFLDVDVETAISRVRSRPEEKDRYIDVELQYKLRQEYLDIARINGGIVINSSISIEETFKNVKSCVNKIINNSILLKISQEYA